MRQTITISGASIPRLVDDLQAGSLDPVKLRFSWTTLGRVSVKLTGRQVRRLLTTVPSLTIEERYK